MLNMLLLMRTLAFQLSGSILNISNTFFNLSWCPDVRRKMHYVGADSLGHFSVKRIVERHHKIAS